MLQESLGGESASAVKKTLAKVQKLLQLALALPNALTLREYREALEECLKPEASTPLKLLGYQLADTSPGCSTPELWRLILEACVTELGGSENASALAVAIPVLTRIPLRLVLGFLLSSEREPMNKLRTVLTHEASDVRCCAIATLSKLTLEVAIGVSGDGLFVFPFESHEARICCQQDVEMIVVDCWKLIFHTLFLDNQPQNTAKIVGAAFSALAMLFARSSVMNQFFLTGRETARSQAPVNDVVSVMYKQAFPRIRSLIAVAQALPMKHQPDAMLWIAMLLYIMMEHSGARCPSISVPYLEIDVLDTESNNLGDDDDDEEPHASTERVRVDELVSGLLDAWAFPTLSRRSSLVQATTMCRAVFVLLSHPLQTFSRLRWAAQLANHLIAQCYFASKTSSNTKLQLELKLELSGMLVKTFAWLSGVNCLALFVRAIEALYLLDHERDRRDMVQALMDTIAEQVLAKRNFQLLEGLCVLPFFRQPKGTSRLSPRSNGYEVFRALVQAFVSLPSSTSPPLRGTRERQVAQLILLEAFRGLLMMKPGAKSLQSHRWTNEVNENLRRYMGLLTAHFQFVLSHPTLMLRESLDFFVRDLYPAVRQIPSQSARLQLLWIGVRLHREYASHIPFEYLLNHLHFEASQLFSTDRNDQEPPEATFDNGSLGGVGEGPSSGKHPGDITVVEALMVLGDCIALLAQSQPQAQSHLQETCQRMIAMLSTSGSPPAISSQQYRVLEEVLTLISASPTTDASSTPSSFVSSEIFDPNAVFVPRRKHNNAYEVGLSTNQLENEHIEPLTVTGSADPVAVQICHHQPLAQQTDVIALEVSCCNLTTWPLSDLELQLHPIGGTSVVKCVDMTKDLKLRLLRAGETSSSGTSDSLPPFGVLKAEKRFQVCRFTQITFLVQAVFAHEGNSDGNGDVNAAESTSSSIRLAFSDRYVVHFDTLLRLPQSQFDTAAFFQHCWQSANASASWPVESLETENGGLLTLCDRVLHRKSARIVAVNELLLDLPTHFHIALLTQTKWGDYVVASLTMNVDVGNTSSPSVPQVSSSESRWSGVLDVRSTPENTREFEKWPQDTIRLFGGDQVQLYNAPPPVSNAVAPELSIAASSAMASTVSTAVPEQQQPLTVVTLNGMPEGRTSSSASFRLDCRSSERATSFKQSTQPPEQIRAPEVIPMAEDSWGTFL